MLKQTLHCVMSDTLSVVNLTYHVMSVSALTKNIHKNGNSWTALVRHQNALECIVYILNSKFLKFVMGPIRESPSAGVTGSRFRERIGGKLGTERKEDRKKSGENEGRERKSEGKRGKWKKRKGKWERNGEGLKFTTWQNSGCATVAVYIHKGVRL